jgi:hypothetical protein
LLLTTACCALQGVAELFHSDTGLVIERVPAFSPNVTVAFDRAVIRFREP